MVSVHLAAVRVDVDERPSAVQVGHAPADLAVVTELDTDGAEHQVIDVLGDKPSQSLGVAVDAVVAVERADAEPQDDLIGQLVEPVRFVELEREIAVLEQAKAAEVLRAVRADSLLDGVGHRSFHGAVQVRNIDAGHVGASLILGSMMD